ncbi:MATE family efflux transporter [Fusibacter sp. JL298sf-3]
MGTNTEAHLKHQKLVLVLAVPIVIENVLQTLLGTTDTYFSGQISDSAIAAIGVTSLVVNLFIAFYTAVSVGAVAVVARYFGKKDFNRVNTTIVHALIIAIGLGGICGTICYVFRNQILAATGANAQTIAVAMPYYLIVAVPSVFLCLQLTLSGCLRAIKDTRTPMLVTGASNVVNIALNVVFMSMEWGLVGLGIATTLSRLLGAILLFIRLKHHDERIHISKCPLDKQICSTVLRIGMPAGIEKLIMRLGQLVYNSMIITLGTTSYVAHTIAGTIESYTYIPAMGIGLAVCTLVGNAMGEGAVKEARSLTFSAYRLTALLMMGIGLFFYITASDLAGLFSDTPVVQTLVVKVLRIIALFQPFAALVQIMTHALQGAGDTRYPMFATLVGIWGIRIGGGYYFAVVMKMGLSGIWWAYALDLVLRGSLLMLRFCSGRWQTVKV